MKKILLILSLLLSMLLITSCNKNKVYAIDLSYSNNSSPINLKVSNLPYVINFEEELDENYYIFKVKYYIILKGNSSNYIKDIYNNTYTLTAEELNLYKNIETILFKIVVYEIGTVPDIDPEIEDPEFEIKFETENISSYIINSLYKLNSSIVLKDYEHLINQWKRFDMDSIYSYPIKTTTDKLVINFLLDDIFDVIVMELDVNNPIRYNLSELRLAEQLYKKVVNENSLTKTYFNYFGIEDLAFGEIFIEDNNKKLIEYKLVIIKG